MKILLFALDVVPYGGQRVALEIGRQLAPEQEVIFVTVRGPIESLPEGVRHVRLAPHSRGFVSYLGVAMRLSRLIQTERVDGVLSFMTTANLVVLTACALSKSRPAVVVSEHNITSVSLPAGERRPRLFIMLMKILYPHADAVVGVSRATTNDLARLLGRRMRQLTIYNPINTEDITRRASEGVASHPWLRDPGAAEAVIVSVGYLKHAKGFDVLLQAMALLQKQVRLVIVGGGPLEDALKQMALDLSLGDRVDFLGHLENPHPIVAAADLLVLGSRWEGFGLVVLEAAALGIPSVTTNVGGLAEVAAMAGAMTVAPEDPIALAAAIQQSLDAREPPSSTWRTVTDPSSVAANYLEALFPNLSA